MKTISLFLCLSLLLLGSCSEVGPTRQPDILSNQIIKTVSGRLNKKYGFQLVGTGGAEDEGGVWEIAAMYGRYGPKMLDIGEAREKILDCAKEFLDEINHNEAFRPYMKVYPFTSKNLSISILNYDEKGKDVSFPYISDISLRSGSIYYKSLDYDVMLPYAKIVTETYEEALEISENQASKLLETNGTEGGIQLL
jgi:hypothetical protein